MKAIAQSGYGDVDRLAFKELPEPPVGPGDVKVRVVAASINPVDWKIRRGDLKQMMPVQFPYVPGRDVSGEVVEVGRNVTAFKAGDRVMGLVNAGYAEFVVSPVDSWARVPESLELQAAAALPLVTLTGTQLLEEGVDPPSGATVLVTGAVGGVGRAAVLAAKARGVKVWAGVRGKQKEEARALGADGVVALDDEADLARLPPLDAIADTVGGPTLTRLLDKVKAGGVVGSVLGDVPGAKERQLTVRSIFAHPDARRLTRLGESVARGDLVIPIGKRFPLARAAEAQKVSESGGVGKVLLTV